MLPVELHKGQGYSLHGCPCGFLGDQQHPCRCTPLQVRRYRSRVSGPVLDRIDIQVAMPRLEYHEISDEAPAESSETVRARVEAARRVQAERLGPVGLSLNSQMGSRQVRRFCRPSSEGERLLRHAFQRLGLSMRAHDRLLKVARTIADLGGETVIHAAHVAEAIQYRALDRDEAGGCW